MFKTGTAIYLMAHTASAQMLPVTHGDNSFPLSTIKSSPASGNTKHHTLCFPFLLNVFYF